MNIKDFLKQIVSINSIYPHEQKLADYVYSFFKDKGYTVYKQPVEENRYNLIVEKGNGKKVIALYNHLDTVPLATGWIHSPFKLTIEDDKAYGLGTYDMKGGMAVNILTFLEMAPKNYKLRLIFCVDEEYISKGGNVFINSPYGKDIDCVVSTEPAFKYGNQGIVTGRTGRAVFTINLSITPVHFMFYEPKKDLTLLASSITKRLKTLDKGNDKKRQFIFVRSMQTTVHGMSLVESITMELDAAIVPPTTNNQMLDKIKSIVKNEIKLFDKKIKSEVSFKKRLTPFLSSYELSSSDEYLKLLSQSVKEVTAKKAQPYFRSSVADENIFGSNSISTLGIGPIGGNAHSPDEWVSLTSLEKLHKILLNFLRKADTINE